MTKKQAKQYEQQRLPIIAELHRKGYSMRRMAEEISKRLGFANPISLQTVHKDVNTLLKEWREARVSETEQLMEDTLSHIDYAIEELYEQWQKSKTDYKATSVKKKAEVTKPGRRKLDQDDAPKAELTPSSIEDTTTNELMLGDPRYIAEIRNQLAEKRKLLGLYAPEKKDVTSKGESIGGGFYEFLKKVNKSEGQL